MKKLQHTPGPWTASKYYITAGKDWSGATIDVARSPGAEGFRGGDAHLIAASLEMLVACKRALYELRARCGYREDAHCCQTLKAAIAKAEGGGAGHQLGGKK